MQTPMKTLQLPEELVDTLQAEALQVGMTIADYLSDLVRPSDYFREDFDLPQEVQEDIRMSLEQISQGEVTDHAQVMRRMYQAFEG